MKKFLLSFVAVVLSLVGYAQTAVYTLDTTSEAAKGTNSDYAKSGEVTVGGVTWNATGNLMMQPWRIGGKSITDTDRAVYTTTPVPGKVNQVVLTLGTNSTTFNSLKLYVADNAEFKNASVYNVSEPMFSGDNTIDITDVTNGYFKFVFNVTVAETSNKYIQFSKVVMNGEVVTPSVEAPVFDKPAGTYYGAAYVRATCATEGASIKYSLNDGDWTDWPAGYDAEHPAGITITETSTLKAKAVKGTDESFITTAIYTIGKSYNNLKDLVAVEPTEAGVPVRVTLSKVAIDSIYTTTKGYRNGIYVNSGSEDHPAVEIYCQNVPDAWVVGGTVSGTIEGTWKKYKNTWEICPSSWDALTYSAPVALATVTIDNPNKVKIQNENYQEITVISGDQNLTPGRYSITSKISDYTLNKVELNGTILKPSYGKAYMVELAADDKLVITADYTPATSKVEFSLPYRKNVPGVLLSYSHSGGNVTEEVWPTGMFEAANGYQLIIKLDEQNYQVDSVLINNVKIKGSYGSYSVTVKEFTNVEIFALPIVDVNAKIVVAGVPDWHNISEYASVHKGGSAYGDEIAIAEGTTEFTVKSNNKKIVIVPVSGKKVYVAVNDVLVDADASTGYFTIDVNEGDEIKVFPEIEFTTEPSNGSNVGEIDKITFTFPDFELSGADYAKAIYDNAIMDADGNYVKNEKGENIKGTLTWGDGMNQLVWQGGNKVTAPGTYTVILPAGSLRFGDTNIQPLYVTLTIPVIAEGEYIIKNVATGKYLGGANDWGTRASLLDNNTYTFTATLQDGKYTLNSHTYNNANNHFLTAAGYIDGAATELNIERVDGGFTISAKEGTYFSKGDGNIIKPDDTEADVWEFISVEDAIKNIKAVDDVTFLIKAANFSRNHYNASFEPAWTAMSYDGTEVAANKNLSGGDNTNCCAESWRSSNGFNIFQTISVPNGTYILKAQAAMNNYDAVTEGLPVVYANEATSQFNNITDGETSMAAMSASFTAGKYYVEPITVTVTDGTLTVGVKCPLTTMWCIFDNFTLTCVDVEGQTPALQMTYPQANTKVSELPEYVTFMFDRVIAMPTSCAIQNGYNDPITIDAADVSVIDGNTVKMVITEVTKTALGTLGKDGVTVYVILPGDHQYDTHFTVAPEFAIESSEFDANGGKLTFNDNVDFVDYATEVKCYVSSVKTKNIATQATLTLDDEEYNVINVTFAETLEAGDYTLDIPEGVIMSTSEEPLASVKVPFTIEESSVLICTFDATPKAGYEDYCGKATFEEWSDKVVIKSYDGTEGHDLTITWDENGYNAINGEASPWVYISNSKYYGAYLYTYDDWSGRNYTGGNWTSEGGEFWIGGYFYENYQSDGDWGYMYWYLTPQGTGVNSIKQSTDSQDGKYFINGKVVIVKNGKKFTVNGARM